MAKTWKDELTLQWNNASQGRVGYACYLTSGKADLSPGATSFPLGTLLNEPKQNEMATIALPSPGRVVKAVAGGTIAAGDVVNVQSGVGAGKFAKCTLQATYTVKWAWGVALSAAAADQIFELLLMPQVAGITEGA